MKLLVQWTLKSPDNWVLLDSSAWASLAKLPEPAKGKTGDNNVKPGWVFDLNAQGVRFSGNDHYAVEDLGGGSIRVTVWNDDPDDWPEGTKYARVWTLLPLAPDDELGGAINTKQTQIIYAQDTAKFPSALPWEDFLLIRDAILASGLERHGIWVSDRKSEEHVAAQESWSWRHWVDHLPLEESDAAPSIVVAGRRRLKPQRPQGRYKKAGGTITYFQRDTDRSNGIHSSINEDAFETTAGAGETESALIPMGGARESFVFTTPTNEPDSADWPNGTYRCQVDVSMAEADLTYGLFDAAPIHDGHFGRVNSGLTAHEETIFQAEAAFSGTGLKLATVVWNPAAGLQSERFECALTVINGNAHMDQSLELTFDADAFADGPWVPGGETPVSQTAESGYETLGGLSPSKQKAFESLVGVRREL